VELEPVDWAAAVVPGAVEQQAAGMAGSELVAVRAAAAVEPALVDSAVRAAPGAAERQGLERPVLRRRLYARLLLRHWRWPIRLYGCAWRC
jgi:hypothetical protein